MKNPVIALIVAVSLSATPALAMNFDTGSLTPTLDFPEPVSEPVSKDVSGINK